MFNVCIYCPCNKQNINKDAHVLNSDNKSIDNPWATASAFNENLLSLIDDDDDDDNNNNNKTTTHHSNNEICQYIIC
jgi:hypothetical protein